MVHWYYFRKTRQFYVWEDSKRFDGRELFFVELDQGFCSETRMTSWDHVLLDSRA